MLRILIVEDDASIAGMLELGLRKAGYACTWAEDGPTAAEIIEHDRFDLVLLDVMLPGIDGFSLLEYIREFETPVIFLTAKADLSDRVKGLRMGAEDYIVKPFAMVELLARIEAVLRRYRKTQRYLQVGSAQIDVDSRTVTKNGQAVDLTLKEFELLLLFVRNPGIALYRETIYERVWNEPYYGNTRTVDLHIQRLRRKMGLEQEIQSVYKVGYRYDPPAKG